MTLTVLNEQLGMGAMAGMLGGMGGLGGLMAMAGGDSSMQAPSVSNPSEFNAKAAQAIPAEVHMFSGEPVLDQ